jgi:hypothetical protein
MRLPSLIGIFGFACACVATQPALAQDDGRLLADANHDGKVTLVEYQTSRRTFLMHGDRNKDGRISAAEWKDGADLLRAEYQDESVPHAGVIGRAGGFAILDTDKNGFVTPAEIDTWAKGRFNAYDLNKDGGVDRKEVRTLARGAHAAK